MRRAARVCLIHFLCVVASLHASLATRVSQSRLSFVVLKTNRRIETMHMVTWTRFISALSCGHRPRDGDGPRATPPRATAHTGRIASCYLGLARRKTSLASSFSFSIASMIARRSPPGRQDSAHTIRRAGTRWTHHVVRYGVSSSLQGPGRSMAVRARRPSYPIEHPMSNDVLRALTRPSRDACLSPLALCSRQPSCYSPCGASLRSRVSTVPVC
jgi:hypothetical protein